MFQKGIYYGKIITKHDTPKTKLIEEYCLTSRIKYVTGATIARRATTTTTTTTAVTTTTTTAPCTSATSCTQFEVTIE